ncbi:hypothetical protein RhiLY_12853 [Ceratobasidium sp. AG-Ba]|nr:hypothetical protein RhiLY_12853 [Ceratobasidium sp. AG-Ba]
MHHLFELMSLPDFAHLPRGFPHISLPPLPGPPPFVCPPENIPFRPLNPDLSLAVRTPKEEEADKRWEKQEKQPCDTSANELGFWKSIFQLGALVAGVCGPASQFLGLLFGSVGMALPDAQGRPPPTLDEIRSTILEINRDERSKLFIDTCYAFDDFVLINKNHLELKAEHDREFLLTSIIPTLLEFTKSTSRLSTSFDVLKGEANWDNPKGRLAIVNCVTRHLSAYSLLCRLYAQIALADQAQGRTTDYENHRQTFKAHLEVMQNILNSRTNSLNELFKNLAATRNGQFKEPVQSIHGEPGPLSMTAHYIKFTVTDEYTEKKSEFINRWNRVNYEGTSDDKDEPENRVKWKTWAQDFYNEGKPLLAAHVERCLRNTKAVMMTWKPMVERTERYLSDP